VQTYRAQHGRGSWRGALSLFQQLRGRWGPSFASTNGPLYGALLEVLVADGGAAGLWQGVAVCNEAHATGE
jgi:hypothetical protein